MAQLDFPNAPATGDTYNPNPGQDYWAYNGSYWYVVKVGGGGGTGSGAPGATGPTGPAGATGATGSSFTYRNSWSSGTPYYPGDVVLLEPGNGNLYVYTTYYDGADSPVDTEGNQTALFLTKGSNGSDGLGFTFRGAHAPGSEDYFVNDVVTSGGNSYVCIQQNDAGFSVPVTNTAFWTLMASRGSTGPSGSGVYYYGPTAGSGNTGDRWYNTSLAEEFVWLGTWVQVSVGVEGVTGPAGATGATGPSIAYGITGSIQYKSGTGFSGSPQFTFGITNSSFSELNVGNFRVVTPVNADSTSPFSRIYYPTLSDTGSLTQAGSFIHTSYDSGYTRHSPLYIAGTATYFTFNDLSSRNVSALPLHSDYIQATGFNVLGSMTGASGYFNSLQTRGAWSGATSTIPSLTQSGPLPLSIFATGNSRFSGNIEFLNGFYINNATDRRLDFYSFNGTNMSRFRINNGSWGTNGPVLIAEANVLSSPATTNIRFDSPIVLNDDTNFSFGLNQQYRFRFTAQGNDTLQIGVTPNSTNSAALALIDSGHLGVANRSPGITHTNPHFYVYSSDSGQANDFVRMSHDQTDANIEVGNGKINVISSESVYVNAGLQLKRTGTAVGITGATSDAIIGVTSTAAARTITLPTAALGAGKVYIIKDESGAAGTNNITIATTSAQTIDGSGSATINTNYGVVRLYSNGSNWFTF